MIEALTEKYCTSTGKRIVLLRLPVGHSELNPIELIWAKVKNEVARSNIRFTIKSVRELVEKGLTNVTARDWQCAIRHTEKVEAAFRKVDFIEEEGGPHVEPMIISLVETDEDTDDEYDYNSDLD